MDESDSGISDPAAPRLAGRERTCSGAVRLVIAWAVAVTLIWLFATIYGQLGRPQRAIGLPQSPVDVLSSWDGMHYRHLAEHGYSTQGEARKLLNLFPLFPATSHLLGGNKEAALAGIVMNQLLLLGSLLLLMGLIPNGGSTPLRKQPGFWLLISPFAFFYSAMYAESLFLFLSLLMISAAYRQNYFIAFIAGLLAGLTRPVAICLPLLLIANAGAASKRRAILPFFAVAASSLLGLGIYVGAVGFAVGDPFGYPEIHSSWNNKWTIPFTPLWQTVLEYRNVLLLRGRFEAWDAPAAVASTLFILLLVMLYGWRNQVALYLPYVLGSLLLIHAQLPFRGTGRYELSLFPVALTAGQSFLAKHWVTPIAAALSIAEQFYLLMRFAQWRWVA